MEVGKSTVVAALALVAIGRCFWHRPAHTLHVASAVLAALGRVTGAGLLEALTAFFGLLAGLVDGFRERAEDVQELLGRPTTAFLIVTSPERAALARLRAALLGPLQSASPTAKRICTIWTVSSASR